VDAVLPECLTCAAARFDHLVILAGGGHHRAAYETDLRGALTIEQPMDDTQEEVLCPRLRFQTTPVAQDVGKYGSEQMAYSVLKAGFNYNPHN